MKTDRRGFLKQAMAGMAVTGVTGASALASNVASRAHGGNPLAAPATAEPMTAPTGTAGIAIPTVSTAERRQLIAEAHFGRKRSTTSKNGMAICSHPLATREAVNVLTAEGNACDAALCAAITQTVIEPHMTGLTGMLSMLYFDAASGKTTYVNGNVNAPLEPLVGFTSADARTGRGAAVPGYWGGFQAAQERHASKSKKELMAPAIRYATYGFEIHPFLWGSMFRQCHLIGRTPQGREIFMPENALPRPGDMLYQKRAADTLERLAEEGNDYFYRGGFAEEYCRVVQDAGGVITRKDMEAYQVRWQEPAWGTYRGYEIAASPPPDNGGTHIIEALNMIELMDLERLGPPTDSPETLYLMSRIHDLVFTEGAKQTDPESHPLPLDLILSKEYAEVRFKLLQMGSAKNSAPPYAGSNHVTVIDGNGNVASILHSCMSSAWSNGLFAGGVTVCAAGVHFLRVMPKPGYRPSVYGAANILFKNNKPVLTSGSPSIGLLANILQNTVNILDFDMAIEESVNRPRFGASSRDVPGATMIEADLDESVRKEAEAKGLKFDVVNPWNWHHGAFEGISAEPRRGTRSACGDPRRCSKAEAV